MTYISLFLAARDNLLRAATAGGEALPKFSKELSSLVVDFEQALSQGRVDPDDAHSAKSIVLAIETIATSFLHTEVEADKLLSAMFDDMALARTPA
jgi:hypothetical protein